MNPNTSSQSPLMGCLLMLAAALSWGGMFPVAKATLQFVDPYFLTLIRYGITALIMLAILWVVEGRAALRAEGRGPALFLFGCAGFCGFSLFVFTGLRASTPAHGAILVALMPLLTAVVTAVMSRTMPAWHTGISILIAFLGVAMVVTDGRPLALLESNSAGADGLILAGVLSWVIYTLGARRFAGWSPLRYSVLTVSFGVGGIALSTVVAVFAGAARLPAASELTASLPSFAYIIVLASIVAVIGWNEGVRRLGPVNGVLFINFVPITAFVIQAVQGQPVSVWEVGGGGMVILALLLNNFMQRPRRQEEPDPTCSQPA
ncbi:EamA family transporter [Parazoarcus communis]|uniref:EamA family transporter n=1 Tax=Parazoarcus communis TaxID=41977 RepID=A0A2U8GZI5_9RHOO|nr:DMT family transporter [Parazoarcus communis]AWI78356.1 EamA family transporter [Parazoarcus communis]